MKTVSTHRLATYASIDPHTEGLFTRSEYPQLLTRAVMTYCYSATFIRLMKRCVCRVSLQMISSALAILLGGHVTQRDVTWHTRRGLNKCDGFCLVRPRIAVIFDQEMFYVTVVFMRRSLLMENARVWRKGFFFCDVGVFHPPTRFKVLISNKIYDCQH